MLHEHPDVHCYPKIGFWTILEISKTRRKKKQQIRDEKILFFIARYNEISRCWSWFVLIVTHDRKIIINKKYIPTKNGASTKGGAGLMQNFCQSKKNPYKGRKVFFFAVSFYFMVQLLLKRITPTHHMHQIDNNPPWPINFINDEISRFIRSVLPSSIMAY